MFQSTIFPSCPLFIRAPAEGAFHYGLIKLAVDYGQKVITGPLNIYSYVLMHTIGAAFSESMKKVGNVVKNTFSRSETAKPTLLKRFVWKLIVVFNAVTRRVDRVYCYVIGLYDGKIRSSEEAAKLLNRELCMSEIFRKVFWEHVKEQFLYIGSWEIGRRGAVTLLKNTIFTVFPFTKAYYTALFFITYYRKVDDIRKKAYAEQKEEIEMIFVDRKKSLDRQIKQLSIILDGKADNEEIIQETKKEERLSQQATLLRSLKRKFPEFFNLFKLCEKYTGPEKVEIYRQMDQLLNLVQKDIDKGFDIDEEVGKRTEIMISIKEELTAFGVKWSGITMIQIVDHYKLVQEFLTTLDKEESVVISGQQNKIEKSLRRESPDLADALLELKRSSFQAKNRIGKALQQLLSIFPFDKEFDMEIIKQAEERFKISLFLNSKVPGFFTALKVNYLNYSLEQREEFANQILQLIDIANEKPFISEAKNLYAKFHPEFDPNAVRSLNVSQQVEILGTLGNEFKKLTDEFEIRWEYYTSTEIDDLNDKADFYKSISKRYLSCKTPKAKDQFKVDLKSYITPKTSPGIIGRILNFVSAIFL